MTLLYWFDSWAMTIMAVTLIFLAIGVWRLGSAVARIEKRTTVEIEEG
jgi:hypothetical protein